MHCDYGEVITSLPDGFVPREQWPEYNIAATPSALFNPEEVGKNPRGVRWSFWPLTFEEYVSDKEPDLSISDPKGNARNRLVWWRRIVRADVPPGWYQLSRRPSRFEGFAEIKEKDYWRSWTKTARYDRRVWHEDFLNKKYTIEKISYPEFEVSYLKSSVVKKVGTEALHMVERLKEEHTQLWGVRDIRANTIIAGMAVIDSPTHRAAYYLSGFKLPTSANDPVMTGLLDHCFASLQKSGGRFLQTGGFWHRGKPRSWKGFSQFKAKFGMRYIAYQPMLVRFVSGKLF